MNCGPRRRFVVAAPDGRAMIVHNCENSVQAIARDVFFAGMRRAVLSGYDVVLRVHDELVCEVPDDPAYSHLRLAEMMSTNPGWSDGLPLAAAGFEAYRYKKD